MKRMMVLLACAVLSFTIFGCASSSQDAKDEPTTKTVSTGNYSLVYPSDWYDSMGDSDFKELLKEDVPSYVLWPTKGEIPCVIFADLTGLNHPFGEYLIEVRPPNANGETESIELNGLIGYKTWFDADGKRFTIRFFSDDAKVSAIVITILPTDADQATVDMFDAVAESVTADR